MSGMEGYFGPREYKRNDFIETEEFINENEYPYRSTGSRPTNINLHHSGNRRVNLRNINYYDEGEETVRKYVGIGVGLATLITENLLSHPFLILRRQCQVNQNSGRFHIIPVTLVPVIIHLHQRQGITTLWKGIGSVLLVRGMTLAVEDFISKISPWPKYLTVTFAIVTPFYSASLVETVQSEIASEKPGIFDVFKDGICRLVSWSSPQKGRMLPVWTLVFPTVIYGLCKYLLGTIIKNISYNIMELNHKQEYNRTGAIPKDFNAITQDIEVSSQLISLISADIICYPLETILHRLHLQGTRTIIDNLDSGYSVTPILTNYDGIIDCYKTTVVQEGMSGLYKGFGALLLQFTAHCVVIKITKYVLTQITLIFKQSPPPAPPQMLTPRNPVTPLEPIKSLKKERYNH